MNYTRCFDQRYQAFRALSGVDKFWHHPEWQNYLERQKLNPGLLGEKHKRYLCANLFLHRLNEILICFQT